MNFKTLFIPGLLLLWYSANSFGHEPKDGEIVRSIQIIVRDDVAHVRIAVGVNDKTLSKLLVTTKQKPVSESTDDLIAALEKSLPKYVTQNATLSINGKRLAPSNSKIQQTAVHHERFLIELQYKIGEAKKFSEFVVKDKLFPKYPGPIRYAIRPRGRALIASSNVAPVLARAKPFQNEEVDNEKQKTITAKLKIIAK